MYMYTNEWSLFGSDTGNTCACKDQEPIFSSWTWVFKWLLAASYPLRTVVRGMVYVVRTVHAYLSTVPVARIASST